jgi:hypothetical protein
MARKPLFETFKLLQNGLFLENCADLLAETVKSVDETGKSGKLVITLDFKKANGAIAVHAKATNKVPEPVADADLLWATVEGNLQTNNPAQRTLDLVDAPARALMAVDAPARPLSSAT